MRLAVFLAFMGSSALAAAQLMLPLPEFPASWGAPPESADGWGGDIVPLAGGYGLGRKELSAWILQMMQRDRDRRKTNYPPAFGKAPQVQTMDYGPLPFGYGSGSSTMRKWLTTKAKEVYHETPEEYDSSLVEFTA